MLFRVHFQLWSCWIGKAVKSTSNSGHRSISSALPGCGPKNREGRNWPILFHSLNSISRKAKKEGRNRGLANWVVNMCEHVWSSRSCHGAWGTWIYITAFAAGPSIPRWGHHCCRWKRSAAFVLVAFGQGLQSVGGSGGRPSKGWWIVEKNIFKDDRGRPWGGCFVMQACRKTCPTDLPYEHQPCGEGRIHGQRWGKPWEGVWRGLISTTCCNGLILDSIRWFEKNILRLSKLLQSVQASDSERAKLYWLPGDPKWSKDSKAIKTQVMPWRGSANFLVMLDVTFGKSCKDRLAGFEARPPAPRLLMRRQEFWRA